MIKCDRCLLPISDDEHVNVYPNQYDGTHWLEVHMGCVDPTDHTETYLEPIQPQYIERTERRVVSLRPRDVVIALHARHKELFDKLSHTRTYTTMQCFRVGFYVLSRSKNGKVTIDAESGTQTIDFWQVRV